MHPILEEFCDKWVWPTMPGAPGAEFRLKLTREKCLPAWEAILERTVHDIEEELTSNDEEWKRQHPDTKGLPPVQIQLLRCEPQDYQADAAIIGPDGGTPTAQ